MGAFLPLVHRDAEDQTPALNLQVFREAGQLIMTLLIPQPQEMSY